MTVVTITTDPKSLQDPISMPNSYVSYNTLSLEWHEKEIEGWITKIRLNKNGVCTTSEKECTRKKNQAVPHGQALGLTVFSKQDMSSADSEVYEYVF